MQLSSLFQGTFGENIKSVQCQLSKFTMESHAKLLVVEMDTLSSLPWISVVVEVPLPLQLPDQLPDLLLLLLLLQVRSLLRMVGGIAGIAAGGEVAFARGVEEETHAAEGAGVEIPRNAKERSSYLDMGGIIVLRFQAQDQLQHLPLVLPLVLPLHQHQVVVGTKNLTISSGRANQTTSRHVQVTTASGVRTHVLGLSASNRVEAI